MLAWPFIKMLKFLPFSKQPIAYQLADLQEVSSPEAGHSIQLIESANKLFATRRVVAKCEMRLSPDYETFRKLAEMLTKHGPHWVEIISSSRSVMDIGAIVSTNPDQLGDGHIYMAFWFRRAEKLIFCPVLSSFDVNSLRALSPLPVKRPWWRRESAGTRQSRLRAALSPCLVLRETEGTRKSLKLLIDEDHDEITVKSLFCEIVLDSSLMALSFLNKIN